MFTISTMNKIAEEGLDILQQNKCQVSENLSEAEVLLLRSASLHDLDFPEKLLAIGRAGAGVNNIPIDACSEQGIIVFNTPGANANAVKELVLVSLFLGGRDILGGIKFAKGLVGESDIKKTVEKSKSLFKGQEIKGKRLGVIGLGAIGIMVANDAISLGMEVSGYDPFISVNRAWDLSRYVKRAESLDSMLAESDFISLHIPLNSETKGFLNEKVASKMKKGSVLLNFSRGEIVDENAIIKALENNSLGKYITDFPTAALLPLDNVIPVPHLGASSKEAETNCSVMVAKQVVDFLENGNICNSVNLPNCRLERSSQVRLTIMNNNIPNVVSQLTSCLADANLNISEMMNKSKDDIAYTIVDIDKQPSDEVLNTISQINGVKRIRVL